MGIIGSSSIEKWDEVLKMGPDGETHISMQNTPDEKRKSWTDLYTTGKTFEAEKANEFSRSKANSPRMGATERT